MADGQNFFSPPEKPLENTLTKTMIVSFVALGVASFLAVGAARLDSRRCDSGPRAGVACTSDAACQGRGVAPRARCVAPRTSPRTSPPVTGVCNSGSRAGRACRDHAYCQATPADRSARCVVPRTSPVSPAPTITRGDIIRGSVRSPYGGYPLYYYGRDGRRHLFPTESTYASWYGRDVSRIRVFAESAIAAIPLGGNVIVRPGSALVRDAGIVGGPVYVVASGGIIRRVGSDALAATLYGRAWRSRIISIPSGFMPNYLVGAPVTSAAEYNPAATLAAASTIDIALGL